MHTQKSSPQRRRILPRPPQRLNPKRNPLHLTNSQLRLLRPTLLASTRIMLDLPRKRVRGSVVRIDRAEHLRRGGPLADLRVVVGHSGGGVGDELVGGSKGLDVAVVGGLRCGNVFFFIVVVVAVIVALGVVWTDGCDAEGSGEGG